MLAWKQICYSVCVCVCVCLQAGLGELFVASRLYDVDYHSLGLHLIPHCLVSHVMVM